MDSNKIIINVREERPEYYPQFGFVEAAKFGITDCNGANYPAFMAMEMQEGYLSQARGGKYYESDIYDDEKNREAVKAYDERFCEEVREDEK